MKIDLGEIDSAARGRLEALRPAVCIVGAGIAGLTLAHRLAALGVETMLLEAGGEGASGGTGLDDAPVRAFGGTSLTWGGQLLPCAEEAWCGDSGLNGSLRRAEQMVGVDALPYEAAAFFHESGQPAPAVLRELGGVSARLSKTTPFGRRNLARTLGRELVNDPRVWVVLRAQAVELLSDTRGGRVEAVEVCATGRGGERIRLCAKQFVVAAGSTETVRLLLASRGVGIASEEVGRNVHDHLTMTAASFHGAAREWAVRELRPWIVGETLHGMKLEASAELRERLGSNPAMAHLVIEEPDGSGVGALREMLRETQSGGVREVMRRYGTRLPAAAADAVRLAWAAQREKRRYVSPGASVHLQMNVAQDAPSGGRVTLADETDACGMRLAQLERVVTAQERASFRRVARYLRERLEGAAGDGVEWNPALMDAKDEAELPGVDDARHAMGGACIGSVVTPELQMHGVENLWVASTAVFPDGSAQFPSLPLMTMALRLGDRLAERVAERAK